jgi:hypothetical protein
LRNSVLAEVKYVFSDLVASVLKQGFRFAVVVLISTAEHLWNVLNDDNIGAPVDAYPSKFANQVISRIVTEILLAVSTEPLAWRASKEYEGSLGRVESVD